MSLSGLFSEWLYDRHLDNEFTIYQKLQLLIAFFEFDGNFVQLFSLFFSKKKLLYRTFCMVRKRSGHVKVVAFLGLWAKLKLYVHIVLGYVCYILRFLLISTENFEQKEKLSLIFGVFCITTPNCSYLRPNNIVEYVRRYGIIQKKEIGLVSKFSTFPHNITRNHSANL